MSFWDASALVPLCVNEPRTAQMQALQTAEGIVVVWWSTRVEVTAALERRVRDGQLDAAAEQLARDSANDVFLAAGLVEPTDELRGRAEQLLARHPLRAADALQLSAAMTWALGTGTGHTVVCLDRRLRAAAQAEGFALLPTTL